MMSIGLTIPLRRVGTRGVIELRLELGEEADDVTPLQQHSTAAALFGFMDEKARSDLELSQERSQHLRYTQEECSSSSTSSAISASGGEQEEEERECVRAAELMGRRVRDIGDEFMEQIYTNPRTSAMIDNIVRQDSRDWGGAGSQSQSGTSSSNSAFNHFCEVVNIILGRDDVGNAQRITIGRVAAVLSYCYHLCKVFILRRGIMGVVDFLGQLVSYLIRSLSRSSFYEHLTSQGGWSQLLKQTSSRMLLLPVVMGSVLLLGFMALKYLRNDH